MVPRFLHFFLSFFWDVEVVEWHFHRDSETTIRAVSPCVEWWGNATETYENETVLSWSKPAVLHIWVMRGGCDPHGFSMVGTIFYIHQWDCQQMDRHYADNHFSYFQIKYTCLDASSRFFLFHFCLISNNMHFCRTQKGVKTTLDPLDFHYIATKINKWINKLNLHLWKKVIQIWNNSIFIFE